ncbi:MAG: type II toxin-antitoxin system VapC family toxin [Dehalococcoidia bacterium]
MTTAVDTNVLLDILLPGEEHGDVSELALSEATPAGAVVVSEPVYAELAARFQDDSELDSFLDSVGVSFHPSSSRALHDAGLAWRRYLASRGPEFGCPQCGRAVMVHCEACSSVVTRRQHLLADFMIGSHALVHAGRLLTRDRGYYRKYFPALILV